MDIHKNYKKSTILSELTRKQSDLLIDDIVDLGISTPRDIMRFRKSETYKKVFGNKSRIWLPLNIEITNVEDLPGLIRDYGGYADMLDSRTYVDIIMDMRTLIRLYAELFNKPEINNIRIDNTVIVFMYINGYLKLDTKNPVKIGSLYAKVIDKIKKTNYDDARTSKMLNAGFERFNKRDTTIPEEVYNTIRNIDNSVLYGTQIKNNKAYVCISKYYADVAAMSTGQGWSSCQNLDHEKTKSDIMYDDMNWHIKYDIPLGTCVAYLISENNIIKSKNAQNVPNKYDDRFKNRSDIPKTSLFPLLSPTARVAIKPHYRIDNRDGASVYLSIGADPVVYGDRKYEQILADTVDKYLVDHQRDISGVFMVPELLYNEHIGEANVVVVDSGVIVDLKGQVSTVESDPSKLKNANIIYPILNEIFQDYYETAKNPATLYCSDISNMSYSSRMYSSSIYSSIYIAKCTLENCKFSGINYIDISKTIISDNLQNDAKRIFSSMTDDEFEKRYGKYGIKKNKLYRYFTLSKDNYPTYFSSTRLEEGHLAFTKCSFNDCEKITVSNLCKFTNCEFINCTLSFLYPIREDISNCKFDNCVFNTVVTNRNTDTIRNCIFNECTFNKFRGNTITFVNCEFNDTDMNISDSFTINYKNCTIDGKRV